MARGSRKGGVTWVAVWDRGDAKVRCLSCSLVMYPKDWWFHTCTGATSEESNKSLQGQSSTQEDMEPKSD